MRWLTLVLLPLAGCAYIPRPGDLPRPEEVRLCTEIDIAFIGDIEVCPTVPLRWKKMRKSLEERKQERERDRERRKEWERRRNGGPHNARSVG